MATENREGYKRELKDVMKKHSFGPTFVNKPAHSKALEAKKGTKSKCENCGGNHKNHSSYVYKTGNL